MWISADVVCVCELYVCLCVCAYVVSCVLGMVNLCDVCVCMCVCVCACVACVCSARNAQNIVKANGNATNTPKRRASGYFVLIRQPITMIALRYVCVCDTVTECVCVCVTARG